MPIITIARLEKAINDCRMVQPPVNYTLGPDLRVLATIWGEMIAARQTTLDTDAQSESNRTVLARWLGAAAGWAEAPPACALGAVDAVCEACQ